MLTFQEAKKKADRIGGVVDWWWVYSVHPVQAWIKFNGTHGYGSYYSKGAKAFIRAHYRKTEKKRKASLAVAVKKLRRELVDTTRRSVDLPTAGAAVCPG